MVPVRPRIPITLDVEDFAELQRLAGVLGLSASQLGRMIITTRLPAVSVLVEQAGTITYAELVSRLRK